MRFKFLCCEVFIREACLAISNSPHTIDPEFSPKEAHENSDNLRKLIQAGIDTADEKGVYDAILLGYGLCGNSTAGIVARTVPLVIPRAHDCCTIFLGSREKFKLHFGDKLSQEWSSAGYMERGDSYLRETDTGKMLGLDKTYEEFVEQYGEENADYIWETLHPKKDNDEIIFIDTPETSHLGYLEKLKMLASEKAKTLKVLQGDMRLIKGLVNGNWNNDEYLVVPPGKTIKAVYDYDEIITV